MLGKLMKHELRATARIMLPVLGILAGLALLANVSIRLLNVVSASAVQALLIFFISAFAFGLVAAAVVTLVIMVLRFYRSLLRDEGYLQFTLPVTVHEHVWAKLLIATFWTLIVVLGIMLAIFLTATNLAVMEGVDLSALDLAELRAGLEQFDIRPADLWGMLGFVVIGSVITSIANYLHFYAAMALGQMFSKKVLLSFAFYFALQFVLQILTTLLSVPVFMQLEDMAQNIASFRAFLDYMYSLGGFIIGLSVLMSAGLYLCTTLCLKKRLNLA